MFRNLSLALLGFAGVSLATPEVSQAQAPFGIQIQAGGVGLSYQRGYSTYDSPGYVYPGQPVVIAPPVTVAPPLLIAPPVVYPPIYRDYGYRGYGYRDYGYRGRGYDRWNHYQHHHRYHR